MNAMQALNAIEARRNGVWDDPDLSAFGTLSTDTEADVAAIKLQCLRDYGFTIGPRHPLIHTDYPGKFMVVDAFEEAELPSKDGRNGPRCIVGDDLSHMIDTAFDCVVGWDA